MDLLYYASNIDDDDDDYDDDNNDNYYYVLSSNDDHRFKFLMPSIHTSMHASFIHVLSVHHLPSTC